MICLKLYSTSFRVNDGYVYDRIYETRHSSCLDGVKRVSYFVLVFCFSILGDGRKKEREKEREVM